MSHERPRPETKAPHFPNTADESRHRRSATHTASLSAPLPALAAVLIAAAFFGPPGAEAASFGTENVVTSSYDHAGSHFCVDVDSDGDIDILVVGDASNSNATWFENNGDGTAWIQNDISQSLDSGTGVFAADIESDGDVDLLALATNGKELWVFKNDGSQTFTGTSLTTGNGPASVVAVDVDGDGDLDLVSSGSDLEWFEQTGTNSGSFAATSTTISSITGDTIFAADLENDGDADLFRSSSFSKDGTIYTNDGTGGFTTQTVTSGNNARSDGIAAGDMDDDGDLDVVVAWSDGNDGYKMEWFEQSGLNSGTIINSPNTIDASVDGPRGIFVDDVDGDGVADVVAFVANGGTAAPDERSVLWWANNGTGTSFTQDTIETPFGGTQNRTGSVCLADIDGDGLLDVAAAPDNEDKISWWSGSATAGAPVANATALSLGWVEECARTWDGSSYVLIAPASGAVCSATTTPFGIWEGFWVLVDQVVEMVIPPRPGSATGNTMESLAGITANQYDLVGVPLDPADGDAEAVVGDDLGTAPGMYEIDWRVAKYDVASEAYQLYTGASSIPEFLPGRGFWLIHDGSVADPATIDVDGAELKQVVGSPPFDGARVVDLSKPNAGTAKHMAANPFDYTVSWGTVKFRRPQNPQVGVSALLESPPDSIDPGSSPRTQPTARPRHDRDRGERPSDRRWLLDLQVRSMDGAVQDLYNRLGVVPGSREGRDRHDALDLAPFGSGWVRLYFPHDDPALRRAYYWRRDPQRLTNDIGRPRRGRMSWLFAVETDLPGRDWELSWPTVGQLPSGIDLAVVDLATGRQIDPASSPSYTFRIDGTRRLFRLVAKTSRIGEEHGDLTGVITDAEGRPVRTAVHVTGPGGYRNTLQTDGHGRYVLHDLDPGSYAIQTGAPGSGHPAFTVEVVAGRVVHRNNKLSMTVPDR